MQFWEEDSIIMFFFWPFANSELLSNLDSVCVRSKSWLPCAKILSLGLLRVLLKTNNWLIWRGFFRLKSWMSSLCDLKTWRQHWFVTFFTRYLRFKTEDSKCVLSFAGSPIIQTQYLAICINTGRILRFMFACGHLHHRRTSVNCMFLLESCQNLRCKLNIRLIWIILVNKKSAGDFSIQCKNIVISIPCH